ncbi:MAG: DNA translocase FtsK, partial [Spirochaetota bacterium]
MIDRLSSAHVTAGVFFLVAAFVGLSIALAFAAPQSQNLSVILFRAPGVFLVESFHLASLYVPAILCVGAGLLLAERLLPLHIAMLLASTVPFFTAASAVRIAARASVEGSRLTAALVDGLGHDGALVVTVVLALAELALLALLWYRTRARFTRPGARGGSMTAGMRRIQALLEAPGRGGGAFADRAAVARPPAPGESAVPASLVDLPDPQAEPDAPPRSDAPPEPEPDAPPEPEPEPDVRATTPVDEVTTFYYRDGRFVDPDDRVGSDRPDEDAIEATPAEELDEDADIDPDFDELGDDEDDYTDAQAPGERVDVPAPPRFSRYDVPIDGLLLAYSDKQYWRVDERTREAAETLRVTLDEFGIQAEVTGIRKGPVITMFEILPAPGVKLSKIVNLSDNIALRLAASSVRIVAPIPGKHAVGIEIPNKERAIVGFAELLQEESFQGPRMSIPIALGKDIPGDAQIVDLTRMPHVLIAGATGSGKSVCVNSIICSVLYRRTPNEVKLILIDPKIVELKFYNDIPHLLTPVITDPKRAFQALQYLIYEMERRYSLLDALQVRDIQSYNRKITSKRLATEPLPYIVVVVDEFADLMATSGKELESTLARLAAMSRAVGIHLVLATQRPSTDVITGLIKANIPSRIAFMVASKVDSRIILDSMGA